MFEGLKIISKILIHPCFTHRHIFVTKEKRIVAKDRVTGKLFVLFFLYEECKICEYKQQIILRRCI